jgi:hypothetical protein
MVGSDVALYGSYEMTSASDRVSAYLVRGWIQRMRGKLDRYLLQRAA